MSAVACVNDNHTCPMVESGPKPHVGGDITQGSSTIKAGGKPVARVGDPASCQGSTDTISTGSGSVMADGKPLARKGDSTAHGGVIVTGNDQIKVG